MKRIETSLPGVVLFELVVHTDPRGRFFESYHRDRYRQLGLEAEFVQDNVVTSGQGVLRGLHYQLARPQGKLVTVARGTIFDVALDIRRGSPTFGRWFGTTLSDAEPRQLWIPAGFAHGYLALSAHTDVHYKVTAPMFRATSTRSGGTIRTLASRGRSRGSRRCRSGISRRRSCGTPCCRAIRHERDPADARILVTGGAGFIGSNFVRELFTLDPRIEITVLDKLTYAANPMSLADLPCEVVKADIVDRETVRALLRDRRPEAIVHLAAETHVDRSIDAPEAFVQTNLVGSYRLLEETRRYLLDAPAGFRLINVSTDEVFGALAETGSFSERSRYAPSSPHRRRARTTWSTPTLAPTTCRRSPPTARTTTARTSTRRS